MSTKQETRIKQIQHLKNFSGCAREAANHRVFQSLIENSSVQKAHTICTFISYKNEVDTHAFIEWCFKVKKKVIVPRVEQNLLSLHQISSISECLPGVNNILEPPISSQKVDPQYIDVFIVPGLAFDMECFRIGYGKGFYDRLLLNTRGYSIGICFTNQIMFSLPHDKDDVFVDRVITDSIQISKM